MNNKNNKSGSNASGIKLIIKHMSKYWMYLLVVLVFIITATFLQVRAPLIMGDAIQNVIDYVSVNVEKNTYQDIYDSIEDGNGIPQKTLDQIKNMEDTTTESDSEFSISDFEKQLDEQVDPNATKAEKQEQKNQFLKQTLDFYKLQSEVIDIDTKSIKDGNGFSEKQLDYISDNFSPQEQAMLLSLTPEELQQNQELIYQVIITDDQIDEKYDVFLESIYLLLAAYILMAVANFIYNIVMARVSALTSRDMRNNLFKKLETLSIRFFDQSNDGDVLSRFTNDIDNINNALNQTLTQVMSQVAALVGVIIAMFQNDDTVLTIANFEISNGLTWQLISFAIVAMILASFIVRKAAKYVSIQQDKLGALNGYIDERISAQKVIITNDLHEETVNEFNVFNDDYKNTSFKGQAYSGLIMPLMTGIGLINLAFLTYTGSQTIIDQMVNPEAYAGTALLTVGTLTAFIQYSQRFFQPLGQIFSQYNVLQLAVSGAARINEILVVEPEIIEKDNAIEIDGIKGNVKLDNVTFGYFSDNKVLKNVTIEVEKNKKVALVGPTGSGKTTVMNLLNRFYDVNEGAIYFGDTNINDMTLDSLRKNVGIVLQESVLFSGTIAENISYGKEDATREEIISAAKTANIHDFIETLDNGYETLVSNDSTLFSVGQKQLMSIARTILTNPDLLILDEATSNVDTVTEAKIQTAMENVMHNRTSFVIAHRLKTILDSDVIVVLKDGEVIEQGSHEQLLKLDGFYAE